VSRVRSVLIAVALLCALYVGAYLALLDPEPATGFAGWWGPRYRVGGNAPTAVFAPLEWLDVRVRPGYWNRRWHPGG
jgi:hypothetical protein